ncbi:hypothetical protein OIU78_020001 [Salix suchowensis]|nr:hypothetical protein OIU78_020001 [Salix suchowensis]
MDTLKSQSADMPAKCEGSPERRNPTMFSKIGAVVRVQQLYRGYRTRRRLADSAVIAQELWWQAIYHADLNENTVSFFKNPKSESAASRWKRVGSHASKVGKGLSKNAESEKLYFEHWIEAIDPRHRYGAYLYMYFKKWSETNSGQPFFYWLDVGDGKEVEVEECPRSKLQENSIKYLGPKEREQYECIIIEGKRLYAGQKKRGKFHHSSFLAGGATIAAGTVIIENGNLKFISPMSGHYRPTQEKFESFLSFFKDSGVNLDEVQVNQAIEYSSASDYAAKLSGSGSVERETKDENRRRLSEDLEKPEATTIFDLNKWSTGAGPRIGSIADYPAEVRAQALEFVNLSSKTPPASML